MSPGDVGISWIERQARSGDAAEWLMKLRQIVETRYRVQGKLDSAYWIPEVEMPRAVFVHIARRDLHIPWTTIAKFLNRHHSTLISNDYSLHRNTSAFVKRELEILQTLALWRILKVKRKKPARPVEVNAA